MYSFDFKNDKRVLSPRLEFLRKFAGPFPDEPLEFIASVRVLLEQVKQNRAQILASGLDLEGFVADIELHLAKLAEVEQRLDSATETHLQAAADLADANFEAFKATEAMVQAAHTINPFDPKVQEAKEFLEAWRQWVPQG